MKPEVDMKDEEVVNHIWVVAVLGMLVHDPAEQVNDDISGHNLEGTKVAEKWKKWKWKECKWQHRNCRLKVKSKS